MPNVQQALKDAAEIRAKVDAFYGNYGVWATLKLLGAEVERIAQRAERG